MADYTTQGSKYGKRSMWQWVLIYTVVAAVVYGGYYVFLGNGRQSMTPASSSVDTSTNAPASAY